MNRPPTGPADQDATNQTAISTTLQSSDFVNALSSNRWVTPGTLPDPMNDQTTTRCHGCGGRARSGSPTAVSDDGRYDVDCAPTHVSRTQSLMGVKSR